MAQEIRQNNLFAAENYQAIYASFANANFQAYDYDTIRAAMVTYIQNNYPEDFNDWIESSEFVALIDLMAFLGHNLAFRADLGMRENILDTAERRESVLRIARQLSYNPKRNITSEGILKVMSVRTDEIIFDSNNRNLQNTEVTWGDTINPDAYEQFVKIINSALISSNRFGTPTKTVTQDNILTQRYEFNTPSVQEVAFKIGLNLNTVRTSVEVVSSGLNSSGIVYEEEPNPNGNFGVLYRNDQGGLKSPNNGFFLLFKEGTLGFVDTLIENPIENQVIDIDAQNINETDVWVQTIDEEGTIENSWSKVDNTVGNNVIFNSIQNDIRKIFAVITGDNDTISLKFADGRFGDAPKDIIRCWYRTSANRNIIIRPTDLNRVGIRLPYIGRDGRKYTLTLMLSLQYTVRNSSATSSIEDIRINAPEVYATQNRMVTAKDYTVYPFTSGSSIKKIKSINRTHSGHSRYSDIYDPTGTYKDLDIFADDGYIYKENIIKRTTVALPTNKTPREITNNVIGAAIRDTETINFYYENFSPISLSNYIVWKQHTTNGTNTTGYIKNNQDQVQRLGQAGTGEYKYLRPGAVIEWLTPTGDLQFSHIQSIFGSGLGVDDQNGNPSGLTQDDEGTVVIDGILPNNSVAQRVWPVYNYRFNNSEQYNIIQKLGQKTNFAIRYDYLSSGWKIIEGDDIGTGAWSLANAGNTSKNSLDTSWLIRVEYYANQYVISNRTTRVVIASEDAVRFFNELYKYEIAEIDKKSQRDEIRVLEINTKPGTSEALGEEIVYNITGYYQYDDGYTDPRRAIVALIDPDKDYVPSDPTAFNKIVGTETINLEAITEYGFSYEVLANTGRSISGRSGLKFHWKHFSEGDHRINPSVTNIIDTYILTNGYDTDFRTWLAIDGTEKSKPLPPTTETLRQQFADLEDVKMASDTIIFKPAKYRILFGSEADSELQAKFKVVKVPGTSYTDNEIKSKVVAAINEYFALENWDFGETFYFTELGAFIHNKLVGIISSVVIVPQDDNSRFGNLFQVTPDSDELFISSAKVSDVQIISQITESNIRVNS